MAQIVGKYLIRVILAALARFFISLHILERSFILPFLVTKMYPFLIPCFFLYKSNFFLNLSVSTTILYFPLFQIFTTPCFMSSTLKNFNSLTRFRQFFFLTLIVQPLYLIPAKAPLSLSPPQKNE